ncbi:hypothetical protein PSCLAVI8L_170047 [Pseudoclavibacter sp. 8L]|nr:hypothetical protein PSCLAVI8L_170047 [Pseudoclavibacter sp. 8L]
MRTPAHRQACTTPRSDEAPSADLAPTHPRAPKGVHNPQVWQNRIRRPRTCAPQLAPSGALPPGLANPHPQTTPADLALAHLTWRLLVPQPQVWQNHTRRPRACAPLCAERRAQPPGLTKPHPQTSRLRTPAPRKGVHNPRSSEAASADLAPTHLSWRLLVPYPQV